MQALVRVTGGKGVGVFYISHAFVGGFGGVAAPLHVFSGTGGAVGVGGERGVLVTRWKDVRSRAPSTNFTEEA